MWRPPNITTNLSSPLLSGHVSWICFAKANRGDQQWSLVSVQGLWWSTAFVTTSSDHGNCVGTIQELRKQSSGTDESSFLWLMLAWNAAQDAVPGVRLLSVRTFFAVSSHKNSSAVRWSKLSVVSDGNLVAGTADCLVLVVMGATSV